MRLALCAALVLAVTGCVRQPSQSVFIDPALATLVPPDATFLAGIRMEQLAASPFFRTYGPRLELVQRLKTRYGVDAARLWEFLIASDGRSTVTLIRGKFSDHGLEPRLERADAQRFSYKNYILIGDEQAAVAFLNPSTAAAGPADALRRVIDRRNEVTGLPAEFEERTRKIPHEYEVWFVSKGAPALIPQIPGEPEYAYGGLDLYSGIGSMLVMEFSTEAAAKSAIPPPMFDSGGARDGRVVRYSATTLLGALDRPTPWAALLGVKSHEPPLAK